MDSSSFDVKMKGLYGQAPKVTKFSHQSAHSLSQKTPVVMHVMTAYKNKEQMATQSDGGFHGMKPPSKMT